MTGRWTVGGGAAAPQHGLVYSRVQGFLINRSTNFLLWVEYLDLQHLLAAQHFDPMVGIHHHCDALLAQGVAQLAAGLHDMALALEGEHQVF